MDAYLPKIPEVFTSGILGFRVPVRLFQTGEEREKKRKHYICQYYARHLNVYHLS